MKADRDSWAFKPAATSLLVLEENHVLITSGPCRYVRNPRYLGFMPLIAGYSIAMDGYVASAVSVALISRVLHARTLLEEQLRSTGHAGSVPGGISRASPDEPA